MAGGTEIPTLPSATTPLDGSELIIVEQGGVTKKSTISASQQIALDAASAAQTTANSANSTANTAISNAATAQSTANTGVSNAATAQSTANTAVANAATAQSTANGKLSTVAVDGTTITGNGTVGNPLVAVGDIEYKGYLTISGGGVTFTSIKNDVGAIAWSVVDNGVLNGVLTSAFPVTKFFGLVGNLNGGGVPYINVVRRLNDNTVGIDIFKFDGTQASTPFGTFAIHLTLNN
jgi:hypothetical protein